MYLETYLTLGNIERLVLSDIKISFREKGWSYPQHIPIPK